MTAEIIISVVAVLLLVLSIFLFNGKGKWLIAGYNTLSDDERKKYDEKKLCRAVGFICLTCSVMLFVMAYLGYRVDFMQMNENVMLWYGLIFAAVVITSIIIATVYANTSGKK